MEDFDQITSLSLQVLRCSDLIQETNNQLHQLVIIQSQASAACGSTTHALVLKGLFGNMLVQKELLLVSGTIEEN